MRKDLLLKLGEPVGYIVSPFVQAVAEGARCTNTCEPPTYGIAVVGSRRHVFNRALFGRGCHFAAPICGRVALLAIGAGL
jgi:hypothetical protein